MAKPVVDLIKYCFSFCWSMPQCKVCANPVNEVVFKCPLDELVKKVGGNQLVDICTREVHREWLEVGERE